MLDCVQGSDESLGFMIQLQRQNLLFTLSLNPLAKPTVRAYPGN